MIIISGLLEIGFLILAFITYVGGNTQDAVFFLLMSIYSKLDYQSMRRQDEKMDDKTR